MNDIDRAKRDIEIITKCLGEEAVNLKEAQKIFDSRVESFKTAIDYLANLLFESDLKKE